MSPNKDNYFVIDFDNGCKGWDNKVIIDNVFSDKINNK